ncbi:transposase [Gorillibacterium sp. CAU 1737]|uniref:transposase n=1 Tax=Gorillibacterium sp. CAU 1737 TaxID=3140362 RepID=UPI00326037DA
MIERFTQSLYETIVEGNLKSYQNLFETTEVKSNTVEYWKDAIALYRGLTEEQQKVFLRILKQTITDTLSNALGAIDGSSTLNGFTATPRLYLDSVDTEGDLQDFFLGYVEGHNH